MRTKFYTTVLLVTAFLLLQLSPPAYSQSETHDFITYDTAISIKPCAQCNPDRWNVRISRPKNMFTAGHPDTASRPCIFSMPGQGEHGVDNPAKTQVFGPHYWLKNGWDGGVKLSNGMHYPILITSCYINNVYPTSVAYYNLLTYLLSTYHIKRNSVHLAGLSQGAFTSGALIMFEKTANDETGMKLVTTLTCFQGTPDPLPSPYSTWSRGYDAYKVWAKKYGGRYFFLEGSGSDNFRDGWHYADAMNAEVPGSAYFSYEKLGGGAHCCWNSMYDPNATDWTCVGTLGPNNSPSQMGKNQMGDYKAPSSVFQWMMQHGDTSLVGSNSVPPPAPEPPPTVSAGSDQTITLPTNVVTLAGTASEKNGVIASYKWSQVSGPSTAGFGSSDKATTTATGLVEGTYQFQLLVTDGLGNTAKAAVNVTVKAQVVTPGPLSANAGSDQTITLPINNFVLAGSGTQTNGTIASYKWTQISGPTTVTFGTPNAASTTVGTLVAGVYKFQLTVTNAQGTKANATVQITVQASSTNTPSGPPNGIKQVVVAEYKTWYITNEGKIFGFNNNSKYPVQFNIGGLKADTGAGGFNYFRIIDEQGYIWNSQIDWTTNTNRIDKDTTGAPFNRNKFVDAYGHAALTIRDDGSIWYFGVDAFSLFYPGGKVNAMTGAKMLPTQLSAPGMKFKKALFSYSGILAMTTDGQVYKWTTGQGLTPAKINIPRPAIDIFISHLSVSGCIIPDAGQTSGMGWPYIWGSASTMWGGTGTVTTPTPVRDLWKMKAPIKEMSVDWNTIHYIDSLGDMYGCGYNSFGEVGNGQEFINKYNYTNWPIYQWTVTDFEHPTGIPQQIGKGIKWKHLYANNWFAYYKYGQAVNDSLYSWGRNKSLVLGNGLWGGYDNGAYHANIMDVLVPTMVSPLTAIFTEYSWTPPSISVGPKQIISTTTATLKGVAKAPLLVSVKKPSPNGIDTAGYKIISYQWTKVSGNGGTITSPNAATTTVTGLSQGTYVFNLFTVDDNTGTMSANDTIVVTATMPGQLIVNAGPAQTITLPTNSVNLTGSASEANGTIAGYKWTQVSGPSTASFGSANQASTTANALVEGVYRFQLEATDGLGSKATATVQITVKAAPVVPGPPSANAGSDQTITLPVNNVTLKGSGSEVNGTIVSYAWTQQSGPATATFGSANQATTTATALVEGVYVFKLTVTDNSGVTASDVVQVTVKPVVPGPPSAEAGADQVITLPVNNVTLKGSGSEVNGTIVSYAWTQVSGPATATFGSANQATTAATSLVEGVYVFQLKVTDNSGVTAVDVVKVTVKPAVIIPGKPEANAGGDKTVTLPVNSVTLAGSGSEVNGTIVSYEWTQLSGPSTANFGSANQATTTATDLIAGVYVFQLKVTDNSGVTATDAAQVTVKPAIVVGDPVADAGADQIITLPLNNVTLTGSGSETNGTIVSYAWTQVSGPAAATFGSANQASTTATNLVEGTYQFELKVKDAQGKTATATTQVVVKPAPVVPGPPSANAGNDQIITLPTSNAKLTGSGSVTNGSIVLYGWEQVGGPATATIANPQDAQTLVSDMVEGTYTFRLTVTTDGGVTATDQMSVTVRPAPAANQPPVAVPGPDQTVQIGVSSVDLDGSASFDPDGNIVKYMWVQTSGGAGVTIAGSNTATPGVYGLQEGVYEFRLTVTDNSGATGSASVTITVTKAGTVKPVAVTSKDTTVFAPGGNNAALDGSASYAPGSTIVSYAWTKIAGPADVDIVNADKAVANVSDLAVGNYVFQLVVTNAAGEKDTATMKVRVKDGQRTTSAVRMYPNPVPADRQVIIEGYNDYAGLVTFVITDMRGRVVSRQTMEKHQPNYSQAIYLNGLHRGTYIVRVQFFLNERPTAMKLVID